MFVTRDAGLLTRAFTVYVRPILEFNCVAWSAQTKQDIEKTEMVHVDRLRKLELCGLELRRLYFDLYMCYRIIFGQASVCTQDFFEFNKKYVLWNVYLPIVVAFHTPLSKYMTVIVMTLN